MIGGVERPASVAVGSRQPNSALPPCPRGSRGLPHPPEQERRGPPPASWLPRSAREKRRKQVRSRLERPVRIPPPEWPRWMPEPAAREGSQERKDGRSPGRTVWRSVASPAATGQANAGCKRIPRNSVMRFISLTQSRSRDPSGTDCGRGSQSFNRKPQARACDSTRCKRSSCGFVNDPSRHAST